MTNLEILTKAIEKANKNGLYWTINPKMWLYSQAYYDIIFDHEFAKAFWGNKHQYYEGERADDMINNKQEWQFHQQQMILEKEPLKYLEKFL